MGYTQLCIAHPSNAPPAVGAGHKPRAVLLCSPMDSSNTVCRVSPYKVINTMTNTTAPEFNMTTLEVIEYIRFTVGGFVLEPTNVDIFKTPFPIHILKASAVEYIAGTKDTSGVVTLYWLPSETPEQLGVSITIPATEMASKPRVVPAKKVFKTVGGVPTATTTGKSIEGMPDIEPFCILISSGITASAACEIGMTNVFAPGAQVKSLPDAEGRSKVMGCFGLIQGS